MDKSFDKTFTVRIPDDNNNAQPQCSPIIAGSPLTGNPTMDRAKRRKDLLLDDEVLYTGNMESRKFAFENIIIYYILVLCSAGLIWLVSQWYQKELYRLVSKACNASEADFFIIDGIDGTFEICLVEELNEISNELRLSKRRCGNVCTSMYSNAAKIPLHHRMIVYRHTRYIYNASTSTFKLVVPEDFTPPSSLNGLDTKEVNQRLSMGGQNVIDIPIPPGIVLFFKECIHPFFIFQIWAVIVWCTEAYYSYSVFIFATALGTAFVNYVDVKSNLEEIRRLSHYTCDVKVIRDGQILKVNSSQLVTGDIFEITHGLRLPCDAVIVQGQATVTEAMLTGETTVMTKIPIDLNSIHVAEARNTLFGGTNVAELRVGKGQMVLACVARTGWESVKGRLVLSILYPRPMPFKFMRESVYFVVLLFLAAMIGFGINAWQMDLACVDDNGEKRACTGEEIGGIIQRGCDMVTIVVPPALPLALTVGVIYATQALRKQKLFCISPPKINLAGKVNAVCFDKTGTLTTDGLQLSVIHPVVQNNFAAAQTNTSVLPFVFTQLLACCHSLTHVGSSLAGDPLEIQTFAVTGASFDEPHIPSGADLVEKQQATPSLSARVRLPTWTGNIVGVFEFQPALQRMGVLVEETNGSIISFVKGSPEAIVQLCNPATVPSDFASVLKSYTKLGFRVLAAGTKSYTGPLPLPGSNDALLRSNAESNLNFLGFIVLDNPLKPQSGPTIDRLRAEAGVWMSMVTGDNAVAAVCVARKCHLVEDGYRVFIGDLESNDSQVVQWHDVDDETSLLDAATLTPVKNTDNRPFRLALTGRAFAVLRAQHAEVTNRIILGTGKPRWAPGKSPANAELDYYPRIILNCAVFARMSPDAKAHLVEDLQTTGLYVLMIGDGANDALALRAAHVGISLSQVEASVAAPFTYAVPNPSIEAIPLLLSEGRGALITSFCLFQFMALYSTIQFANALLIVFATSFLSNNMYMYQDLFTVFVLALTLGNTPAARKLTIKRPSGRLFSGQNLLLTFGFIGITFGLQAHVFLQVRKQSWYDTDEYPAAMQYDDPYAWNYDYEGTNSGIPETTTVFLMSCLQYVAVASIFSIGAPYKLGTHHNYIFLIWLLFCAVCAILLFFSVEDWVYWLIGMLVMPSEWNKEVFGWSVLSMGLYFIWWGVLILARYTGLLRNINILFCGRKDSQHKRLRGMWKQTLGSTSRVTPSL